MMMIPGDNDFEIVCKGCGQVLMSGFGLIPEFAKESIWECRKCGTQWKKEIGI